MLKNKSTHSYAIIPSKYESLATQCTYWYVSTRIIKTHHVANNETEMARV